VLVERKIGELKSVALISVAKLRIVGNWAYLRVCGAPHTRKNWLFAGSDAGGKTAAVLYTITQTCKRHQIDPFEYLRDVLARIPSHPADRLAELVPHRWAQSLRDQLNPPA